jgi:hypothetical protein
MTAESNFRFRCYRTPESGSLTAAIPRAERSGGETRAGLLLARGILLPGPYRFYYLPQSRLLVSADKWQVGRDGPDKLVGHAAVAAALVRVFNFTSDELALNRARKLSPRQKQRLIRDGALYAAAGLTVLAPTALIFINNDLSFWWTILFGLLLGGLGFYMLWQARASWQDAHHGIVSQIEGKVTLRVSSGARRATNVYYVLREFEFFVPVRAYYALVEGINYRVYYTPKAQKIVAIEPSNKR